MLRPRFAKNYEMFRLLTAAVAFLVSGLLTASPDASAQQGHLIPPQWPQTGPIGYKILSPTGGIDFLPYLATLDVPLARNFLAKKPKSIASGGKRVVTVRVQIQKDGSLPEGAVAIVLSSGNEDVDAAAVSAIRAAAPFPRLPEKYSGAYLALQVLFYFKNKPPEQQPKIVPLNHEDVSSASVVRDADDRG